MSYQVSYCRIWTLNFVVKTYAGNISHIPEHSDNIYPKECKNSSEWRLAEF